MSGFRQSDYREFGMLSGGRSAADPDVLARAVRSHKAGDALAQMALTVLLMAAICAVTFVLSVDRAAAGELFSLTQTAAEGQGWEVVSLLGLCTAAVAATVIFGRMSRAEFQAHLRHAPARMRRDHR